MYIPNIPKSNKAREALFLAGVVPNLKTLAAKNGIIMLFPSFPPDLSGMGHAKESTMAKDLLHQRWLEYPEEADPGATYGRGFNAFFQDGFNWPLPWWALWRRFWARLLGVLVGAIWGYYRLVIAACPLDNKPSLFIDYNVDENKKAKGGLRTRLVGWFSSHIRDYVREVVDLNGQKCLLGRFCLEFWGHQFFFGWFLMIPLES